MFTILLDCNFVKVCMFVIPFLASHIDTTVVADGTYELIPESEGGDQEAQVNATTLTKDPDQSPEEPKVDLVSDYREASPGHKSSISNYALYLYYLLVHLQFLGFELKP